MRVLMNKRKYTAAARPCGTCPYALSTPSGIWAETEYAKLPEFDRDEDGSMSLNQAVFMCHKHNAADNVLCRGWLITHGDDPPLGMRMGCITGKIDPALLELVDGAECYRSGREAYEAGIAAIAAPSAVAVRKIKQVAAVRERAGAPVEFS